MICGILMKGWCSYSGHVMAENLPYIIHFIPIITGINAQCKGLFRVRKDYSIRFAFPN